MKASETTAMPTREMAALLEAACNWAEVDANGLHGREMRVVTGVLLKEAAAMFRSKLDPKLLIQDAILALFSRSPVKDAAPAPVLTEDEREQYGSAKYHAEKYPSEWWSEAILELTDIIDRLTAPQPADKPGQIDIMEF